MKREFLIVNEKVAEAAKKYDYLQKLTAYIKMRMNFS